MIRLWLLTSCLIALGDAPAPAQSPSSDPAANERKPAVYEIIQLKNLDLVETASLIKELDSGFMSGQPSFQVAWSESVNGLILHGDLKAIAEIKSLVERLENVVPRLPNYVVEVLKVNHADLERLVGYFHETVDDCDFAADSASRRIIARGPAAQIGIVKQLLAELDQPQATLRLIFDAFSIDASDSATAPPGKMPADLQGVRDVLAREGVGPVEYLGRTTVRTQDGEVFKASGMTSIRSGRLLQEVSGTARAQSDPLQVRLHLEARLELKAVQFDDPKNQTMDQFQVESVLTIPAGETVVLAGAPNVGSQSGALAICVRAEIVDAGMP